MQFIVYDFEVFAQDWLVVFKKGEEITIIINDTSLLQSYYDQHKTNIFVGFNNKHYDDYIFKGILGGLNPKRISDFIILKEKQGWEYPGMPRVSLNTLDVKQDIVGGLYLSLKEIEGNLCMNIEEYNLDFNITRKLTDDELYLLSQYCIHDVKATEQILLLRKDDLVTRMQLLTMFNLPISNIGLTNAKLTAVILNAIKKEHYDELIYDFPDNLKLNNNEIKQLYDKIIDYRDTLVTNINGVEHTLAYGGLHGAKKGIFEGNIWYVDVSSYYPSLMLEYNYISRNLKDNSKYREIYDLRMKYKAEKDPREKGLKLVLNTTYGAMKNKYNPLFDPKQANQVCITGQLFLIDLLEKLEPYSELIQSNTDGIIFKSKNDIECKKIIDEWQSRTKMNLKIEKIDKIWQKDVNNYIMLKNNQLEVKGSYVKKYNGGDYISNTATIIDKAIVDYLVYGISVKDTIFECNDIFKFQYIVKKGPTYKYVEHNGKIVNNCNRVFASKDTSLGKLYKVKEDGRKDSIAELPQNCVIVNNLDNTTFTINDINKLWYIEQAINKINDFIGE